MTKRGFGTQEEKDLAMESTRVRILEESKSASEIKPRYGLFSYTGSLAIGDNSGGIKRIPGRDEQGLVITGPRNFYTSPGKKSGTNQMYFSQPAFLAIGDPYNDPLLSNRKDKDRASAVTKVHDAPFKGASRFKEPYSYYPYKPQSTVDIISRRITAGEVRTEPRNFLTSGLKKGNPNCTPGLLLSPYPEHRADDYERKRKLEYIEHKVNRSKMQDQPFRGLNPGGKAFATNREAFGYEGMTFPVKTPVEFGKTTKVAEHNQPFKPSSPTKKGQVGVTLSRPAEYVGEKEYIPVRKVEKNVESPPAWRTTYRNLSRPTPSVVQLQRNILKAVRSATRV